MYVENWTIEKNIILRLYTDSINSYGVYSCIRSEVFTLTFRTKSHL